MELTIVVAYDGSAESRDGIALGAERAALEGAHVLAVDVLQNLPAGGPADRAEQLEVRARIAEIETCSAGMPRRRGPAWSLALSAGPAMPPPSPDPF